MSPWGFFYFKIEVIAIRWFKHISSSRHDLKIKKLLAEFGYEGYGVYWMILETVAEVIKPADTKAIAEMTLEQWKNSARISPKKFQKIIVFCSKTFGFLIKKNKKTISIEIPKSVLSLGNERCNNAKWKQLRKEAFEFDNYTCQYCGAVNVKLECDHIIAYSSGGEETFSNLITACHKCNSGKSNKTMTEWLND